MSINVVKTSFSGISRYKKPEQDLYMAGKTTMRGKIIIAMLGLLPIGGPALAQGGQFTDPSAYCQAVGTISAPDTRYGGVGVPDWIRAAFLTPQEIAAQKEGRQPDYGIAWRCVQGSVLACQNAQTPSCMKPDTSRTPSAAMLQFCKDAQHSASVVPRVVTGTARMLAYDWVCRGPVPTIAKETPLDAQGFVAADWKRVKAK